jgi:hypothetical protein
MKNGQLEVQPRLRSACAVQRVFRLTSPPRLVIDVDGRTPRAPFRVAALPLASAVRVGARKHGTRVVVDLKQPLGHVTADYVITRAKR